MAIMFANKMGAQVTAISRGDSKKADATELGATSSIALGDDIAEGIKGHEMTLDLILCTINPDNLRVDQYLPLLRNCGYFVIVVVPPEPLQIPVFLLLKGNAKVTGNNIATLFSMFDFAVKHDLTAWIQKSNMDDINKAMPDFKAGKPRYRSVLVNTDNDESASVAVFRLAYDHRWC